MVEQSLALGARNALPVGGSVAATRRIASWAKVVWGVAAIGAVAGAFATGAAATAAAAQADGPDLLMLLRFMAGVKGLMGLGLIALAAWRLGFPARPAIAAWYTITCGLMPLGAGLIWGLAHVALGAVLFHAGMFTMFGVMWADQDDGGALLTRAVLRRRA